MWSSAICYFSSKSTSSLKPDSYSCFFLSEMVFSICGKGNVSGLMFLSVHLTFWIKTICLQNISILLYFRPAMPFSKTNPPPQNDSEALNTLVPLNDIIVRSPRYLQKIYTFAYKELTDVRTWDIEVLMFYCCLLVFWLIWSIDGIFL